jgi:aminoglycoside phosphotransferase (APT) family kinase protein
MLINETLVRRLISSQFPDWKDLPIRPVTLSGWDNKTFHLGEDMLIRMPSAAEYASQVEKEHKWLPKLAPFLPLPIPVPLAIGKPADDYPWSWSIYRWLEGEIASSAPISNLCDFAKSLAQFLIALQRIDSTGGPLPGPHSFYRGGLLKNYDCETRQAIGALKGKIDVVAAIEVWETALKTKWNKVPVSWTLFKSKSRVAFREMRSLDDETWARGRGWALGKALINAAGSGNPNNTESSKCRQIIDELLEDHKYTI